VRSDALTHTHTHTTPQVRPFSCSGCTERLRRDGISCRDVHVACCCGNASVGFINIEDCDHRDTTERDGLGGNGLDRIPKMSRSHLSRCTDCPEVLSYFVIHLGTCWDNYFKLGHDYFHPNPYPIRYHPAIRRYIVSCWQAALASQPLRSGVRDRVVMWDFVVDKVAPGQVSSEYFGFACQIHSTNCSKKSSINQSSGICTIGQMGKRLWRQYKGLIDT
jgi:hypothetical protein